MNLNVNVYLFHIKQENKAKTYRVDSAAPTPPAHPLRFSAKKIVSQL
jgi:hypothetical protein